MGLTEIDGVISEVTCPTCLGQWQHFRQCFTGDYENVRTAPCRACIEGKVPAKPAV